MNDICKLCRWATICVVEYGATNCKHEGKQGGKRAGAGAPLKADKKLPFSTRVSPELLAKLRAHELPAAQIIDRALRDWFGR